LLLAWHFLGQAGDLILGLHSYVWPTVILLLLGVTLRNTWIASQRRVPSDLDGLVEAPLRRRGFVEALDRYAIGAWNVFRWPFLPIAVTLVVLSTAGTVMALHNPSSAVAIEDGKTPTEDGKGAKR
jgi:hypothetical protein